MIQQEQRIQEKEYTTYRSEQRRSYHQGQRRKREEERREREREFDRAMWVSWLNYVDIFYLNSYYVNFISNFKAHKPISSNILLSK